MRLSDTRTLERLVRWRIPDVPPTQTFDELFRTYPFTLLDAGDTWSVSGLCGRIWTLARDYPRLSGPEAFRDWDERGTVRVLFAHWAERGADGRAELVSRGARGPGRRGRAAAPAVAVDGDRAVRAAGGRGAAGGGGAVG